MLIYFGDTKVSLKVIRNLMDSYIPPLQTFAISFDLRKAFDIINHDILITTLADLSVPSI